MARETRRVRFKGRKGFSRMRICREAIRQHAMAGLSEEIRDSCRPDAGGGDLLKQVITKPCLSASAYDPTLSRPRLKSGRILKGARITADPSGNDDIMPEHIGEAIRYPQDPAESMLDRQLYLEGWIVMVVDK